MAVWSEGYFTDVEYLNYYFRELSPLFLNLNLTLAGYDIPRGGIIFAHLKTLAI